MNGRPRRESKRARLLIAILLSAGLLAGPTACGNPEAKPAEAETTQPKPSKASKVNTELGSVQLEGGTLRVGTGWGSMTFDVGTDMVPFERSFVETGMAGAEARDDAHTNVKLFPLPALEPGIGAHDFATLLASRDKAQVMAVDDVTSLGEAQAVAAETTTSEGLPSRVYLLTVNGVAWNLTLTASTRERLDQLVDKAATLKIQKKAGEDARTAIPRAKPTEPPATSSAPRVQEPAASDGSSPSATAMPSADPNVQSVSSDDGQLSGRLDGSGFTLLVSGTTLVFPNPGDLAFATGLDGVGVVGIERAGVPGYSVVFSKASAEEFASADRLAASLSAGASGQVVSATPLGTVSVAGRPAVAAEVRTADGAARRRHVLDVDGCHLAIEVRSPDVEAYPVEQMVALIEKGQPGG